MAKEIANGTRFTSVFVTVAVAASASVAPAAIITVPGGVTPGTQYRLAIVTSGSTTATSANIAGYNQFVTADAQAVPQLASLDTTWSAIGSTPSVAARDNIGVSENSTIQYPIYNLAGQLITVSYTRFWDRRARCFSIRSISPIKDSALVNTFGLG